MVRPVIKVLQERRAKVKTVDIQGVQLSEAALKTLKSWQENGSIEVITFLLDDMVRYIALPDIDQLTDQDRLGIISDLVYFKQGLSTLKKTNDEGK